MRPADRVIPPSDPVPADLAAAIDRARLRLGGLGRPLCFYTSIGSTNDVAASLIEAGHREGAVVVADAQTAGRGRRGRGWFSPRAGGLYVSVVLAPSGGPRMTSLLTLAAGVAVAEGIEQSAGLRVDLKWPNDLLCGARKVGGILAEAAASAGAAGIGPVALGVGINVGPMTFPPELAASATSLDRELGKPVDRAGVLVEALAALAVRYGDLLGGRFDAILEAWRARAPGAEGRRVSWLTPQGRVTGVTRGVDPDGALLIGTERGTARLVSGEVDWI